MSSMKSKLGSLMMAAAMMGGMGGFGSGGGTGKYEPDPYQPTPTDEQRKMFTNPPKLSKKQKAKRRR